MFENFKCTDVLLIGGAFMLAPVAITVMLPALPLVILYHVVKGKK